MNIYYDEDNNIVLDFKNTIIMGYNDYALNVKTSDKANYRFTIKDYNYYGIKKGGKLITKIRMIIAIIKMKEVYK